LVKFKDCVDRVLDCKKGVAQADRVVKFVAAFVALTSEEGGLFGRLFFEHQTYVVINCLQPLKDDLGMTMK